MIANRYNNPIQDLYISQYVPIPFEQLYALGKEYAAERKAAEKLLTDHIKSVGEFLSLISKDVDSYYDIAMTNTLKLMADDASKNPSLMKDAAWRSLLNSAINSVDYASLSKLKKSAELADAYDKLYKQLASRGDLPPGWEPDYFTNYSTLDNGIFNETPLSYQSVNELVMPYIDKIPDTFLGSYGGYNWTGVSEDTLVELVNKNKSEILNTPIALRHMKLMQEAGLSPEEALEEFLTQAFTVAKRNAHRKPTADPYAMAQWQYKNKTKTGKSELSGSVLGQEDMLSHNFKQRVNNLVTSIRALDQDFLTRYENLFRQNGEVINDAIGKLRLDSVFEKNYQDAYDMVIKKGGDTSQATSIATAYALEKTPKSNLNSEAINALQGAEANSSSITDAMTLEAFGKVYQLEFNKILGVSDLNANPFTKIKHYNAWFGSLEYFKDDKAQLMWSYGVDAIYEPISGATEKEVNLELFGKEISNDGQGFKVSPSKLQSPKNFIFDTNSYIRELADDAKFDVKGTALDRSNLRPGDDLKINLEELLEKGDLGRPTIKQIKGYIDTPEARNYVVEVSVPISEDSSAAGDKLTKWYALDDVYSAIASAGYNIERGVDGEATVSLTMILPDTNMPIDKTRRNRKAQKEYGTTETKESQISQDDYILGSRDGYVAGEGF